MTEIWYKNAKLNGNLVDIKVKDGKFVHIGKTECDGIDLGGNDVFPGLIDIHCHGGLGHSAHDCFSHIEDLCIYLAKNGITTWYPTIGSVHYDKLQKSLEVNTEGLRGANIPGFHLEGPFISAAALGSGTTENIKSPKEITVPHLDRVKLINIAPEIDGALDFIKNTDVRFAIGHTMADYNLTIKAIDAGADSVTHAFNAMSPLHHREPGVMGAAIERELYVQVICDGIHIHKSVILALYRLFGKKMMLISDAVWGLGLPDGEYTIPGGVGKRFIKDGAIRTERGNLAGSASNLYRDVLCAIKFGIPRGDAFYAASTAPAEYMGLNKGKIALGYDADFLVVDSENKLLETVIGGEVFSE